MIGARHITSSITVSTTKIVLSLILYDFIKRRPMLSHFITCTSMCQIYKSNISENRGFCYGNEDYYKVKRLWITQLPSEALIYIQGHRAGIWKSAIYWCWAAMAQGAVSLSLVSCHTVITQHCIQCRLGTNAEPALHPNYVPTRG